VVVLRVQARGKSRIMGIVVDAVSDVHDYTGREIAPAPELGGTIGSEFVRGLVTASDKMIIVLDIDHLLSSGDLAPRSAADELDGQVERA
jgi:purine-binding chemotaxis protein CheW